MTSRMEPVCVHQDMLEVCVRLVRVDIVIIYLTLLVTTPWMLYTLLPFHDKSTAINNLSLQPFFCFTLAVCPDGWFGFGCQFQCPCENSNRCDPVSGICVCNDGWTGANCEKGKVASDVSPDVHSKHCGVEMLSG